MLVLFLCSCDPNNYGKTSNSSLFTADIYYRCSFPVLVQRLSLYFLQIKHYIQTHSHHYSFFAKGERSLLAAPAAVDAPLIRLHQWNVEIRPQHVFFFNLWCSQQGVHLPSSSAFQLKTEQAEEFWLLVSDMLDPLTCMQINPRRPTHGSSVFVRFTCTWVSPKRDDKSTCCPPPPAVAT